MPLIYKKGKKKSGLREGKVRNTFNPPLGTPSREVFYQT